MMVERILFNPKLDEGGGLNESLVCHLVGWQSNHRMASEQYPSNHKANELPQAAKFRAPKSHPVKG